MRVSQKGGRGLRVFVFCSHEKVVRNALRGAASIAGLLITTEAMVAERPKKEAAQVPMPGGMGGMGGMAYSREVGKKTEFSATPGPY